MAEKLWRETWLRNLRFQYTLFKQELLQAKGQARPQATCDSHWGCYDGTLLARRIWAWQGIPELDGLCLDVQAVLHVIVYIFSLQP